jgi:hypothetical protein
MRYVKEARMRPTDFARFDNQNFQMKNAGNIIDCCRTDDLTIEELRGVSIFSQCSDEQLSEMVDTIKRFTVIMYDYYHKMKVDTFESGKERCILE